LTRVARVAGLLVSATALAACGGGSSAAVHRVTSTTTSVTATAGGNGPSVNIGIICSTPRDAALSTLNAWISNNRAAARRCASPAALDVLFTRPTGSGGVNQGVVGWILQGCAGTVCSFAYPHGTLQLTTSGSDVAGWVVTRAEFGRR
jgi:hypothetical protein